MKITLDHAEARLVSLSRYSSSFRACASDALGGGLVSYCAGTRPALPYYNVLRRYYTVREVFRCAALQKCLLNPRIHD